MYAEKVTWPKGLEFLKKDGNFVEPAEAFKDKEIIFLFFGMGNEQYAKENINMIKKICEVSILQANFVIVVRVKVDLHICRLAFQTVLHTYSSNIFERTSVQLTQ